MALRTVINKVAKFIINASSDNTLLLDRINRAEDLADSVGVQAEIEGKANKGSILMIEEEPGKLGPVEEVRAEGPNPEPDNGLPTPEEELAVLKKRGMIPGEQARRPGF
jgi:hypothetical protein